MSRAKVFYCSCCLLFVSLTLLSCGGGSSPTNQNSGTNPSTTGQAQGVYEGTTSTGYAFDGIDLPNDTFYAIYGNMLGNVLYVCGMATGQGTSGSTNYTASETDFDYCGGSQVVYSGSVTAAYTQGVSMNGSITENGNTETFTATVPPSSQFSFSTAASLSSVSGTWNGSLTDGESATVTIDSLGNVNGVSSDGCSFSGTITADTSNKNFFDVSITMGGSPCLFANQGASGIGVDYLLSDGTTTQLIAGVSSASSFGIVFAAQR
jgi:hypothetical protein